MLEEESSHPVGVIFYNYFSFMILIKYMLIINDTNERTLSTTFAWSRNHLGSKRS